MDNYTLVLFIVMLVINLVMAVALNLISRDVDDLHKFIMSFLDDMLRIENEKLEIIQRRNREEGK